MDQDFDIVVIGSGIAGLSFAIKAAAQGLRIGIITKKDKAESNTNYAQGGIACVTSSNDNFEFHIQDTLRAGDGLCDEKVVRSIVEDGPKRIHELIELGVSFSKNEKGDIDLGQEGGHSERRILHAKDMTGRVIEKALLNAVAQSSYIQLFEHFFAIDIITQHKLRQLEAHHDKKDFLDTPNAVVGLYVLDTQKGKVTTIKSPIVLLASGGIGQVYQYTTNPSIATGDGIAMAYRAGACIANMEFVQFHPTSLYTEDEERFLISEAVRGEGGILVDMQGEPFMKNYHPLADLAPRDIVARAIDSEMKKTGAKHMWLVFKDKTEAYLKERFPQIYDNCFKQGIRIPCDPIPVVPAAHYLCGGVQTDLKGRTTISGLYAAGEVACTGLHGANRLASNSLLEAVVMAHHALEDIVQYIKSTPQNSISSLPNWVEGNAADPDERVVLSHTWDELKHVMWNYVGIVRTNRRLERAQARIQLLAKEVHEYYWDFKIEPKLLELRNMIEVANIIVASALQRKESRGLHYTLDYPNKFKEIKNTVLQKSGF